MTDQEKWNKTYDGYVQFLMKVERLSQQEAEKQAKVALAYFGDVQEASEQAGLEPDEPEEP